MHTAADLQKLPPSLRALVEGELQAGEQVQWVGQPNPLRAALLASPISLFGIAFAAIPSVGLSDLLGQTGRRAPPVGLFIFISFFILVGVAVTCIPFWVMYGMKGTAYAVTTSRVILLTGGLSTTIKSFDGSELKGFSFKRAQRGDGAGTLSFERPNGFSSKGRPMVKAYALRDVPQVKQVEDMVRALIAAAPDASTSAARDEDAKG
jgi:hypothetical protein